jgi:hypothetical protein
VNVGLQSSISKTTGSVYVNIAGGVVCYAPADQVQLYGLTTAITGVNNIALLSGGATINMTRATSTIAMAASTITMAQLALDAAPTSYVSFNTTSKALSYAAPPAVTVPFVDAYQVYVAPNGNDTTGSGSQQNPYLTIERAIVKRATIVNTVEVAILLSSGTYTPVGGGITLSQNTFLCGIPTGEIAQPVNVFCQIGMVAGTGQCTLFGFSLFPAASQAVLINGVGTYNISNCNITSAGNYCVVQSLGTLFMTNCRIVGPSTGSLPAIGGTGSAASTIIRDCLITTTGTPSLINHIGTLAVRQCVLTNTSASVSVGPLVIYAPTTAGTTCEISYCTLQYTSVVSALNKICVRASSALGVTAAFVNFVYNLLLCEGAQSGTGPANYHCADNTGPGTATMRLGNCVAGDTAHSIDTAISHTQYQAVV